MIEKHTLNLILFCLQVQHESRNCYVLDVNQQLLGTCISISSVILPFSIFCFTFVVLDKVPFEFVDHHIAIPDVII